MEPGLLMRLPRFTTRRLMVLVAMVALCLSGGLWTARMLRERDRRLQRAALHSRGLAAIALESARGQASLRRFPRPDGEQSTHDFLRRNRPWIAYHEGMRAKYLRAARYPWLPVGPDT